MKNILFVVFISMIFLFVCCNTTTNKNIIETEISDFDKILDSFQVNGSILIYDNDKNTFYSNDFDWAKNGKLPASTFKIPNSIIAVELGIIENDTTILKWNGEQRKMDIWEKDLSFKDAFRISLKSRFVVFEIFLNFLQAKNCQSLNCQKSYFYTQIFLNILSF